MKRHGVFLMLAMAACGPIPQSPCINPGVDIVHPNFYVAYDYRTLENYYGCVYQNADGYYSDEPFYLAYSGRREYLKLDVQYQWNLWRQLYTRTKPALEIERLWLDYYAQQSISRQQLEASQRAAYEAGRAADEAQSARDNSERHERKVRKEKSDSSNFNAAPLKLDDVKFTKPQYILPATTPSAQ